MDAGQPKPNKYKAYRERKKAAGLKQVRIWALDPEAPGFRERLRRDIARINACEEERRALAEIEANTAELWRTVPE